MLTQSSVRSHRLANLFEINELIAAQANSSGGWEIHIIRNGRLAGAGIAEPGVDPLPIIEALVATSDHSTQDVLTEETLAIANWLDQPGVRLVRTSSPLSMPTHCGGHLVEQLTTARKAAHFAVMQVDASGPSMRPVGPGRRLVTRIQV
jgi:DNA polymerase-3 subunit epsilon